MSFLGIGKSIHPMRTPASPASPPHRSDEFPAGYSLAGCAPASPASASPTASEYALKSSYRSIAFHRTVNSVLTVCLTLGGRSTKCLGNAFCCFRIVEGDDRSLSEADRQKEPNVGVMVGAGRFGPSRKKEAAARRFGNYELWVLNAVMIRTMLVERQDTRGILSLPARVITVAG
jgi:hypothetical protein